jgi:hypothetical protein
MDVAVAQTFRASGRRRADALLIASTSFERRCLGFATFLAEKAPSYKAEAVLLISYSDRSDRLIRARVQRFSPSLGELLKNVSEGRRVERQQLEPYEIVPAFELFQQVFSSIGRGSSVVVDISTITKVHLLYILEAARLSGRVGELRLVYTRARYGRYDTLSWGAEEPVVLPSFGAPRLEGKGGESLVLFCGLEPDRCYSVWRRYGQDSTTTVFVDGGDEDYDRCADRAERLNSFDAQATRFRVPAFQPDQVLRVLRTSYEEAVKRGRYLYISPLTTKWEILAVWLFFREIGPDALAAVLYSAPGRLNASGHTRDELGECLVTKVW